MLFNPDGRVAARGFSVLKCKDTRRESRHGTDDKQCCHHHPNFPHRNVSMPVYAMAIPYCLVALYPRGVVSRIVLAVHFR